MAKHIICHRRGTASDWANHSTLIPAEGEIVIEIDEINSLHKLKIGDGIHTYAELSYLQAGEGVTADIQEQLDSKTQVKIIRDDVSEALPVLKIYKISQEQYDQNLANGTLEEDAIYLTPDGGADLSEYATIEQLNEKADVEHSHDDVYYTETEINTLLLNKSDASHHHDDKYDTKGSAGEALASAKSYTNSAVAQKSQVQITTWEVDD